MQVSSAVPLYIALVAKIAVLVGLWIWGKQCFSKLVEALAQHPPGVERSWGGLGGNLGGWSMSRSLVWLMMAALTMVLFAAVALQLSDGLPAPPKEDSKQQTVKPTAAATGPTGAAPTGPTGAAPTGPTGASEQK